MAGLTPFQFSSKMTQEKTTSGILGGVKLGGIAGNILQSAFSWYEMWINPEKVTISTNFIQKPQHTAGSIVTYHYRKDTPKMSVSGQCGWVGIPSQVDGDSFGHSFLALTGYKYNPNDTEVGGKTNFERWSPKSRGGLQSDNTNNSPRVFLNRLRDIAEEPMYFIDSQGVEHYNMKMIKIYTKQYPDGVICEGYYTKFDVPETSDDVQTISYDFEFTIENIVPVTLLDRKLSMFGSSGKGSVVGSVLRGGS